MNNKFPLVSLLVIVLVIAGLGYLFWSQKTAENTQISEVEIIATVTPSPTPTATPFEEIVELTPSPEPSPSPIPLKNSDKAFTSELEKLERGKELVSVITKEEPVRKLVRAVYGLSQGRVVREFRPVDSPKGKFIADKIGKQTEGEDKQELYRISPENEERYADYIAIFSMLNNDASVATYNFLRPTFEEAYQELGAGEGSFHQSLLDAIDLMLSAPSSNQAMLLVRPSVRYKFADPELEKLPPAHKLMLRMGVENSEALKLELKSFKQRLEKK